MPPPLPTMVAGATLAVAAFVLLAGAPVAWLWLAVCAATTLPVVVWFAVRGRLFEPLPLLAAAGALFFVARPLQLFLDWRDLYSYFPPAGPVDRHVLLEGQEVALFVTERLTEPLGDALARASGACAVFLVLLLVGYRLRLGDWLGGRLAALRTRTGSVNELAAIGLSLAIGLAAQVAIVARAGGPVGALETASDQVALSDSFALFVLAGFAPAGIVMWVIWRWPQRWQEWAALALGIAAVCSFFVLAGSRARVFILLLVLAVIVHHLRRRWRTREVVGAGLLFVAFASSFVVFRGVADEAGLGRAADEGLQHALDERVVLNDLTSYDNVLFATTLYGRSLRHERGGFLLDAVHSYVPGRIDPDKPEGGDILFRRTVWGELFTAGRPPTAVGDLYIDFGFAGVAAGALLVGVLCRALLGLLGGAAVGRPYRVALFALLLIVLYEFVADTLSIALGFALTLVLPFLVGVHAFGRIPRRARRAVWGSA